MTGKPVQGQGESRLSTFYKAFKENSMSNICRIEPQEDY